MATKMYVLDTNVLMGAPDAIYGFDDNVVVLPSTVLQINIRQIQVKPVSIRGPLSEHLMILHLMKWPNRSLTEVNVMR